MRILVTGGAGKIGSWLVAELLRPFDDGRHDVVVFDNDVATERPGVSSQVGDITNYKRVWEAVSGVDAVVHLAAVRRPGLVPDHDLMRINVLGAFNVHEAAWQTGVRKVVSASSEAVLGWQYRVREFVPDYLPIDEDHPARPQDAYGLSKLLSEEVALAYARKSPPLETVVLRPPWVLTPDRLEELRASAGRRPDRFELGTYIDVRDLVRAFRRAVERPIPPGTILSIAADDSWAPEPLSQLLPSSLPDLGTMADGIAGTAPAVSNARAKEFLDWRPQHTWRGPLTKRRPAP